MKLEAVSHFAKRPSSDILLVFVSEEEKVLVQEEPLKQEIEEIYQLKDFSGKKGEFVLFYPKSKKEKRVFLIGLGDKKKLDLEAFRRIVGEAVRRIHPKKLSSALFCMPTSLSFTEKEILQTCVEGAVYANYHFQDYKDFSGGLFKEFYFLTSLKPSALFKKVEKLFEALSLTRDLVNKNADEVTPSKLAEVALDLAKRFKKIKVEVFDKRKLEQQKMGLLLAVGRASEEEPKLILLTYRGAPKKKKKIALVGKGVTYDTGGLSLKPTTNMIDMRQDMGGAGSVLGVFLAMASLDLPVNVVGAIPTAENSIDSKSYKIGDVYTSYSKKTVEITNTDAEGRLILADAISYVSKKFSPDALVTVATLTGGVVVALGDELTGFFSTCDKTGHILEKASKETGELAWPLPFYLPYKAMLKSEMANIKNSAGREASSIQAALFLHDFVPEKIPFIHLDIAGTAFFQKAVGYHPAQATGMPVRLLVEFLSSLFA